MREKGGWPFLKIGEGRIVTVCLRRRFALAGKRQGKRFGDEEKEGRQFARVCLAFRPSEGKGRGA